MSGRSKRRCIKPSAKTANKLCDDVLCDTFQHLSDYDLCAVAEVCSVFKRNAQAEFKSRWKNKRFAIEIVCNSDPYIYKQMFRLRHVPSLFRNFGSLIKILEIDCVYISNKSEQVMKSIVQYCATTLTVLSLKCVQFTAVVSQLQPVFSLLKMLELVSCWDDPTSISNAAKLFSNCPELHTLSLNNCGTAFNVELTFPELKSIVIEYSDTITERSIENVLELNPQLKEIKINQCYQITNRIIRSIAKYTPRVEKIVLNNNREVNEFDFVENVKHLKRLNALKSLEIDCEHKPFAPVLKELIAANISLEYLQVHDFHSDA